ncbi:MAG: phasin family protein [Rhizobiaceae bacterium]
MRNQTRKSDQTLASIPDMPVFENAQRYMMANARLQAHLFKAFMSYQIEMLGFLKHRYEQDVKLADNLIASDQLNDSFDVMQTFMQKAANEYAAEAGKIASISSRIASNTAKEVKKETEAVIEDLAAQTAS